MYPNTTAHKKEGTENPTATKPAANQEVGNALLYLNSIAYKEVSQSFC